MLGALPAAADPGGPSYRLNGVTPEMFECMRGDSTPPPPQRSGTASYIGTDSGTVSISASTFLVDRKASLGYQFDRDRKVVTYYYVGGNIAEERIWGDLEGARRSCKASRQ